MKTNTRTQSCCYRFTLGGLAVAITAGLLTAPGLSTPADAATSSSTAAAPSQVAPKRWSYVWQRWDGTNYASQSSCLARGRAIKQHYSDVKDFTCRKPCGRWWLYTYRQQWV